MTWRAKFLTSTETPLELRLTSQREGGRWFLECINQLPSFLSTLAITRSMLDLFTPRWRTISAPDRPSSAIPSQGASHACLENGRSIDSRRHDVMQDVLVYCSRQIKRKKVLV
jgi:hypothetical protein